MNPNLLQFLLRIEKVADKMRYGTISCNVILINGYPKLDTFYIVSSCRKRFPIPKLTEALISVIK
jgi:hypothetical protein